MSEGRPEVATLELAFTLVTDAGVLTDVTEEALGSLAQRVLEAEGAAGCWEVTVAVVDDDRLQGLHRDFLGSDTPTDIMTFPSDEAGAACRGGELAISVDHARTQAAAWGMSPADEVRFLVVHGLLHLLGWRDDSGRERDLMLARQQELLDSWKRGS